MNIKSLLIVAIAVLLAYSPLEAGQIPDFVEPMSLTMDSQPAAAPVVTEKIVSKSGKYEVQGDIVIDRKQRLGWMRKSSEKKYPWEFAKGYCNELVLGGHYDWFLPFASQLAALIDKNYKPTIEPIFEAYEKAYWTKDESDASGGSVILYSTVSFRKGRLSENPVGAKLYVRCARPMM